MSGRTPLMEKPSDDTTIEMIATSTTELSDSEGSSDGSGTVHGNDAAASCHTTSVHTLASLHPSSPAMTTKPPLAPQALSPVALRVVWRSLEFILLNGPLLVCWALVLTSLLVREVWNGPLDSLLDSYRLEYDSSDGALGTYDARDHELTYYYRRCDHRDISTHDANDLLIDPGMTQDERKAVVMTHGAVVMKEILGEDTAVELRSYLEGRHHEFHSNKLKLPWDELFWDGDNGNRLSLGLGPEDAPIVARAISEVGSNAQLKRTLEATLGPDPAVVEVSTLSTMHNAEPQGIHTDSDWFGSSVLYARTFLHSYTMFIALQDTTSKMGATTVCPGTHWCADADLEELCQCNYTDDDEDKEHHLGYCNTFEASSNGQTGLDVGVLERGDAMMFNQNIWHRGPRNFDLERKENRVMFILTFVSRRDFQRGDNRQQGWGTYYYMRHSMWGHLFSDLKNAASGGMDLLRSRIWRAYGLVAASRPGNLPWLEHWARQLGNNMDFFRGSELEDFKVMLRESTNPLVRWLVLDDAALQYLFGTSKGDSDGDGDGDVGWNEYLGFLVESSVYQTKQMYFILAVLTALAHCIGYAVRMALGHGFGRGKSQPFETRKPARRVQPVRGISRCCAELLASHLLVLGIALVVRQYVLYQAPLFERIHKGEVFYKPIPPLPVRRVVEYEHDEETGEVVSESTHYEDVYALDLLEVKQEREQHDFRMAHPKHPYAEYYDLERDLLEGHGRSPEEEVLLRPPIQATAFPERMDVLIGSRYDARFLASMNSVLDFHPGNKDWIGSMNEYMAVLAGQDPSKLAEAFLDMAVDAILSKILDFGAHPSSSLSAGASIPRRFLRQDFETGWWVVMRRDEVALETRRVLLSMAFPGSLGVSYYYWKEVLAEARFGRLRRSAMGRTWIPQTVEQRTKDLFRDSEDSGDAATMVTPMHTMVIPMNPRTIGRRLLLPSTGRNILPKSMITGKTAVSLSMHCLKSSVVPPTVLAFREHLKQLTEDVVTLKIGDHVQYSGGDVIYQATIVDIDSEEETLEIQPLRNDSDGDEDENEDEDEDEDEDKDEQSKPKPITRFVHVDNVQLYRPLSEGDLVWALTEDPNTGDEDEDKNEDKDEKSWKIYEVLFISPFGQADLILTPEFLTNGDDDEDSPDNNPIMMDTRDLDLKETQKTRLRQYH